MTWGFALVVSLAMSLTGAAPAAATPAIGPPVGDARQVIVVTGRAMKSTYATVRAYQRGTDGKWRAAFPAMAARNGYAGWAPATHRVQDTGTTPIGTFRITEAFGLAANPGARLPYRRIDGNDYWVGDQRDPRTYNMFQPALSPGRTWRATQAERLASFPRQYAYVAVIDFNRPPPESITWDSKRDEHVTKSPANVKIGSAIFLHVSGKGPTAGCVSVSQGNMIKLLRWLDPAAHSRIVMGPGAEIS